MKKILDRVFCPEIVLVLADREVCAEEHRNDSRREYEVQRMEYTECELW